MNTKNNRQFRLSEQLMEAAMTELMNSMEFEKITVKKICEKAGVNRSTFYAHYTDIFDMIEKMKTNLQKELLESYPVPGAVAVLSLESLLPFLRHIHSHMDFYRVALQTRREFPIRQGYQQMWKQVVIPLCQKADITSESEMMLYFIGFQAGLTMILKQWVDTGCQESEEKIAQIIRNCIPLIWQTLPPP